MQKSKISYTYLTLFVRCRQINIQISLTLVECWSNTLQDTVKRFIFPSLAVHIIIGKIVQNVQKNRFCESLYKIHREVWTFLLYLRVIHFLKTTLLKTFYMYISYWGQILHLLRSTNLYFYTAISSKVFL